MNKNDVPQDQIKTLGGLRKAMYATDKDGNYTVVPSDGWIVEELVLNQAIEEFERQTALAKARCIRGESSPLAYHMYNNRMDVIILSQSTGFLKWQVKRHLKPKHFSSLSANRLSRYADVLGISVAELTAIPDA